MLVEGGVERSVRSNDSIAGEWGGMAGEEESAVRSKASISVLITGGDAGRSGANGCTLGLADLVLRRRGDLRRTFG